MWPKTGLPHSQEHGNGQSPIKPPSLGDSLGAVSERRISPDLEISWWEVSSYQIGLSRTSRRTGFTSSRSAAGYVTCACASHAVTPKYAMIWTAR